MIDTVEKLISHGVILTDDKKYIKGCSEDNTLKGVIVIPDSIKGFQQYGGGFKNCKQITHIRLSSSFKEIHLNCFYGCSNLIQIEIPDSVEFIDGYDFDLGLRSLRRFRIPQRASVNHDVLRYLNSVYFEVDDNNPFYTSIDGSLYSKKRDRLIKYYSNKAIDDVVIDSNTVGIEDYAFSNCATINTVYLPDSVISIGDHAFSNCVNLKEIRLPDQVEVIDYSTFYGCESLSKIIIPEKVKKIFHWAFCDCKSLCRIEIKGSSVDIENSAFVGCSSLKEFYGNVDTETFLYTHLADSDSIQLISSNGKKIIAEDVFRHYETQLKVMSILYNSFGMNITKIRGDVSHRKAFKSLDKNWPHSLEEFYDQPQTKEFVLLEVWHKNSGIGLVLGWNRFRAIDVDAIDLKRNADSGFDGLIEDFLSHLGLPKDYPWVIISGSGYGFHIIFKCDNLKLEFASKSYTPNPHYEYVKANLHYNEKQESLRLFSRLELRWRDHLVLPPSIHDKGRNYKFYKSVGNYEQSTQEQQTNKDNETYTQFYKMVPCQEPEEVSIDKINNLVLHYCGRLEVKSYNFQDTNFKLVELCKCDADYDSWAYDPKIKKDSLEWLEKSTSSEALNSLALKYVLGDDVDSDEQKALFYFTKSNCDLSHFNIASLIACGYFKGTIEDVEDHLAMIRDEKQFSFVDCDNYDDDIPKQLYSEIRSNAQKLLSHRDCYLFFDTETTGIPKNYKAPSSDIENWPRLVQLAWILSDQNGNRITSGNYIIKPEDFVIPIASSNVHGITTQKAKEKGVLIKEVLDIFLKDFNKASYVVGHNVEFDKKIVGAELVRLNMQDVLDTKISYCTMQTSIDLCKIPSSFGYGYNFPKLQDLYKKLFGTEFNDAHNAMSDIEATEKCFWELKRRNLL